VDDDATSVFIQAIDGFQINAFRTGSIMNPHERLDEWPMKYQSHDILHNDHFDANDTRILLSNGTLSIIRKRQIGTLCFLKFSFQ